MRNRTISKSSGLVGAAFAAALAGVLLAGSASAEVVVVPPVTINSLGHHYTTFPFPPHQQGYSDGVDFPCGSGGGTCTSAGFSATLDHGDTVQVRVQAPAGQRFRVVRGATLASESFSVYAEWLAAPDSIPTLTPPNVTFESLTGPAPAPSSGGWAGVGDGGSAIAFEWIGTVSAGFTFTAATVSFPVDNFPPGLRATFGPVQGLATFAFGAGGSAPAGTPDQTLMVLEPIPPPECANGIDDDHDGLVDYPADPGCASASDLDERSPTLPCDDGVDNDGDGGIDVGPLTGPNRGDPACQTPTSPSESPRCDDGIDNDGDGKIDWGGGQGKPPDPQCKHPWTNSEAASACGIGAELAPLLIALHALARRGRRSDRHAPD